MSESGTSFEDEAELRALHVRAYGPDPDIQDDPAAFARLIELEAVRAQHASAASPSPEERPPADPAPAASASADDPSALLPAPESLSPPGSAARLSLARRLTSSPSRLLAVATAAGLAAGAVIYAVATLVGPRPDATLAPTAAAPDELLIALVRNSGPIDIDLSTLQSYETFGGIEPWYAVDDYGNPCLILIERSRERLVDAECTPAEADLVGDYGEWPAYEYDFGDGLPDGSIVRFQHRGNSVEAFVHPVPGSG